MTTRVTAPMEALAEQSAEAFRMWVSFFPTAPLFGVEWQFANLAEQSNKAALEAVSTVFETTSAQMAAGEAQIVSIAEDVAKDAGGTVAEIAEAVPAALTEAAEIGTETTAEVTGAMTDASFEAMDAAVETAVTAADQALASVEQAVASLSEVEVPNIAASLPENLFEMAPEMPDDLKQIKGIGPGLEGQLNALGIYQIEQIAALSEANLVWIDENLTAFKGRCFRDDWVGQAQALLD